MLVNIANQKSGKIEISFWNLYNFSQKYKYLAGRHITFRYIGIILFYRPRRKMLPAINHLYIIAVLMLCQLLVEADYEQCGSQYSIFGMMLRGHTFKRFNVSISFECNQACMSDFRCHSFHFVITKNVCELNNRTKEARPGDFIPDWHRYYFRRNNGMGEFV